MKAYSAKRTAALMLAAAMVLSGSASALFGRKSAAPQGVEGAPTARDLEIRTYKNIPCEARFFAGDSEGEDITFALEKEPKKGSVTIEGANFTYTPKEHAVGGDRFTYTAADSSGNVSLPATVTVTIEKTRSGVAYADMGESAAAAAAQCLAEEGIFVGPRLGGQYYFQPEAEVSRSEFLAMVLEAAGREVTEVTMTGFCDDASIPVWAKSYVAAGVADGIVLGKTTAEGPAFRGEEPITFGEAATVLDRVLGMEDVDLKAQYPEEAVPSWAAQAVGNLAAAEVLPVSGFGRLETDCALTRAEAANMLVAAVPLLNGETAKAPFIVKR